MMVAEVHLAASASCLLLLHHAEQKGAIVSVIGNTCVKSVTRLRIDGDFIRFKSRNDC